VEVVLKSIRANPPRSHERPDYPNYHDRRSGPDKGGR